MFVIPDPKPEVLRRLRRMIAEPTEATYTDADLIALLQEFPTARTLARTTGWPTATQVDVVVWDIHAAATRIWEDKVAALIGQGSYDIDADGQTLHRDQKLQQYRHAGGLSHRPPARAQREDPRRADALAAVAGAAHREENTEW